MKKVLIAAKLQLREELSTMIDWKEYGYRIVESEENVWDAQNILDNEAIDLLVIEKDNEEVSCMDLIGKVPVIVITNKEKMDSYIREKLQGVTIYLEQPTDKNRLIQALNQIEVIKEEKEKTKKIKQKYERLEFNNSIVHLVLGKYTNKELVSMRKSLSDKTTWQYISLEFELMEEEIEDIPLDKKVQLENSCINYILQSEKNYSKDIVVVPNLNKKEFGFGLLCDLKRLNNRNINLYEYLAYLRRRLSTQFKIKIQIFMGKEIEGLENISESYESIAVVKWLHAFSENKEWLEDYKVQTNIQVRGQIEKGLIDELLVAIEQGEQNLIEESIERFYMKLCKNTGFKEILEANIHYLWCRLVELSTRISWENNYECIECYLDFVEFERVILCGKREKLLSYFIEFSEYIRGIVQNETKGLLVRIEEYIQENYKQNISLKLLGEKFYINNVYLGQLFKKKYGLYFRDYMNRLRIEKSTDLLKTTNLRVYEVAKEVGFHNTDYFINKFVQFQETTPQQYRIRETEKIV